MKTFSTSGTGSGQTLSEIESDKIPVYDTKTDAESDLANLTVGQIIAIKDEGNETSTPVDVVEDGNMHAVTSNAVANSCPRFPDYAHQIILPNDTVSWIATEDCFVTILQITTGDGFTIKIDNVSVGMTDTVSNIRINSFIGYIKKGQTIEYQLLSHENFVKIFPLI